MGIYCQLMYFLVFSGFKVNKAGILAQFYNRVAFRVVYTGADVYLIPLFPQFSSQLADIDVHAAGISCAQVPYRAAMYTEYGYFQLAGCHQNFPFAKLFDCYLATM